jgi:superfamily I DNA and/or RNA helicase
MRGKLGVTTDDEIFVGTPEMFRGVEKDIIIVAGVRNSIVDGLGQLDHAEYVKLALTRGRHFLWMITSSITLIG